MAQEKINFKRDKFWEMILHFSKRGIDEGVDVGSTKLNKMLFFADFRAYSVLGNPISGAKYQKLEHGPAPTALLPVREEMVGSGDAVLRDRSGGWSDVLVPQRDADLSEFSGEELAIMDNVYAELAPLSAVQASNYSHEKSPGWEAAEEREMIPYETARIGTERPPETVFEHFRQLHAVA